ncbi:hypothetical protein HK098_004885 [Nowakowskiella sp. JEL0407]|nr:hypothetical protein HK098_004885 [Nowakowskiella sp. JEL0407]
MQSLNIFTKPPVLIYLGGINIYSYGLFAYDKNQAKTGGWRVRERTLQLTGLLGGWIGGMMAMQQFRHKTVKKEFTNVYYSCVAVNIVGLGCLAFLGNKLFGLGNAGGKLNPGDLYRRLEGVVGTDAMNSLVKNATGQKPPSRRRRK